MRGNVKYSSTSSTYGTVAHVVVIVVNNLEV